MALDLKKMSFGQLAAIGGGLFVVVSNLIVDMLYALLDSRVRTARR